MKLGFLRKQQVLLAIEPFPWPFVRALLSTKLCWRYNEEGMSKL